jgi:hypothetical protein
LLIYYGLSKQSPDVIRTGYVWLFVVGGGFLIRLLLDAMMVRRPLLEPNLSAGGLTFTGLALLVFLMANVVMTTNPASAARERLEDLLPKEESPTEAAPKQEAPTQGNPKQEPPAWLNPGYPFFQQFASFSNEAIVPSDPAQPDASRPTLIRAITTRATVILAHLAVVVGMVWIGYRHFEIFKPEWRPPRSTCCRSTPASLPGRSIIPCRPCSLSGRQPRTEGRSWPACCWD